MEHFTTLLFFLLGPLPSNKAIKFLSVSVIGASRLDILSILLRRSNTDEDGVFDFVVVGAPLLSFLPRMFDKGRLVPAIFAVVPFFILLLLLVPIDDLLIPALRRAEDGSLLVYGLLSTCVTVHVIFLDLAADDDDFADWATAAANDRLAILAVLRRALAASWVRFGGAIVVLSIIIEPPSTIQVALIDFVFCLWMFRSAGPVAHRCPSIKGIF